MAIQLEFINLIIPIKVIENKYTGGWNQCVLDHKELIGGRVWYDDFLFKDGAMDPMSMKYLVDKWEDLGFQPFDIHKNNPIKWVDMCVVDTFCGGLTLPCDWIVVDSDIAFMKGTTAGNIVGREPGSE